MPRANDCPADQDASKYSSGAARDSSRMWRVLAVGTAIVAVAVSVPSRDIPNAQRVSVRRDDLAARAPLRWLPPPLRNPIVVHVPTGYFGPTFPTDRDVLLLMPHEVRWSSINVTGGRNVRLIGGSTMLNTNNGATAVMRFTGASGSVFIEGTEIDVNGHGDDGIDVAGSSSPPYRLFPDVYIENCRITGLNSTYAGNHADIFQPQGSIGRLFIDKLTGQSNYQGIFIPPQFPIQSASISRVNLSYGPGGQPVTYLLWLLDPGRSPAELPYPIELSDVWIKPRPNQTLAASVAPWSHSTNADGVSVGAIATDAGTMTWPGLDKVSGYVEAGVPPRGDFVPAGIVGLGYVSPGYDSSP